jgi:hypothetical protein
VIFYWPTDKIGLEIATVHHIHLEDLEELILVMVEAQGIPFLRIHILNWNFPKVKVTGEVFQG